MAIIAWMLTGLIVGVIAAKIIDGRISNASVDYILLGILGGIAGGVVFDSFISPEMAGFNIWSLPFAAAGAAVLSLVTNFYRRKYEKFMKD